MNLMKYFFTSTALKFGEFTLKSGRKAPYFFNMANVIETGDGLNMIAGAYEEAIGTDRFGISRYDFDFIFGPAYKGIPLVTAITLKLGMPNLRWGYNRKEEKTHGEAPENRLIGTLKDFDRVLIVDDVLTTADTKIEAWNFLKSINPTIIPAGIIVAIDREELLEDTELKNHGLEVHSLFKISDVFKTLIAEKLIKESFYREWLDYLNSVVEPKINL